MFDTVLFDLDGTLTNPFEGITGGVIYALERLGYAPPQRSDLVSFIGPPLFDEFSRRFSMDEQTANEAVRLYREYYLNGGIFENEVLDGARELLAALCAAGKRVCLATSKPEPMARKILEHFGLLKYFSVVGAAALDGSISKKADVVKLVLEQTRADKNKCVLVGDRFYDIEGAHAAGIKCIAVLCGFGSREEFESHAADYICRDLFEVKKLLNAGDC